MNEELLYFYPSGHEGHFEPDHPESPERVESIRAVLQEHDLWDRFPKIEALNLSDELLTAVHSAAYLNLLALTCERGGHLESDTYTTPASWKLAHQAAGGAAAVASAVWEGKAHRGFALTRPPGHHATHGQGMGFCLLNNVAIAAEYLLRNHTAKRLAVIDLDLHHGNGTQDIFWDRDDVFYISTHQSPLYPGTGRVDDIGAGPGEGWTANFPLPRGSGDSAFITIMDELILPLLDQCIPSMILVSYGFDPHWRDPLGELQLTADGYARLVKKLCDWSDLNCKGKIALFLEGGYDLMAARACGLAVTSALVGLPWEDPYPCPYGESFAWRKMLNQAHSIWKV